MKMNLNTKGIATATVSITDYQLVASKVARVIVAFTGNQTKEQMTEALASKLKYLAAPVENSFRLLRAGVAVGYIRANKELRPVTEKELKASYRVMAANGSTNILMNNEDSTLWDLKEGAGGMYLARRGDDNLSDLVHAATNRRTDVPRLSQLVNASVAAPREFVAFASDSGDMDYGFCVKAKHDRIRVVSSSSHRVVDVPSEAVASVLPVTAIRIPRETHNKITAAGISRDDVNQQIEYYTRLFSYDQAYLNQIIKDVEDTAAM